MIANDERLLILRSDNVWNKEEVLKNGLVVEVIPSGKFSEPANIFS